MNEGKAKTDFARAVIERAMINGITPAQAAKEIFWTEGRGEDDGWQKCWLSINICAWYQKTTRN